MLYVVSLYYMLYASLCSLYKFYFTRDPSNFHFPFFMTGTFYSMLYVICLCYMLVYVLCINFYFPEFPFPVFFFMISTFYNSNILIIVRQYFSFVFRNFFFHL